MIAWFGAAAKHVSFYPGTSWKSFEKELEGYETSKGTIRFQPDHPLPAALVRRLVKLRIARNAVRETERAKRIRAAAPQVEGARPRPTHGGSMIAIERLGPGDAARAERAVRTFKSDSLAEAALEAFLRNPANYLLVAEQEGEAIGFLLAYRLERADREASQMLVTKSKSRRRGGDAVSRPRSWRRSRIWRALRECSRRSS